MVYPSLHHKKYGSEPVFHHLNNSILCSFLHENGNTIMPLASIKSKSKLFNKITKENYNQIFMEISTQEIILFDDL